MIQVITALVPLLRDVASNVMGKTKETAKGVTRALDGRVGLVLMAVWLYPFFTMFVPYLQGFTLRGFEAVRQLPDWYIDFIMIMSAALVGVAGFKGRRS